MKGFKPICLFITLIVLSNQPARSAKGLENLFKFENFKSEINSNTAKPNKTNKGLNVFVFSNASLYIPPLKQNLNYDQLDYQSSIVQNPYPLLDHNQSFTEFTQKLMSAAFIPPPPLNSPVLFYESEAILQKSIQEMIQSLERRSIDMVVFAGNQVYSNDFMRFFKETVIALESYKIPYYQVIGPNEIRGPEKIETLVQDRYYMLRAQGVNFLVLDNSLKPVVPENLPEEASEESLWLEKILHRVEDSGEDLIIIAYNPLDTNTISFINKFPKLKLIAVIKSDQIEFARSYETRLKSNPILINNQSLISYPCAYLNITRDSTGYYDFKIINVGLPQIQQLAKSRLD